ncbi:MAG: lamin tail domain-containing protein [Planctomycetes bacterium]|jgi:hypothetical protein|nr:lamin tail domain-containing protein [Planctomycetota bacterium]
MLLTLASALAFCPQGPGPSTAPVVINEYSNDDSGTDNLDFVELFNRTAAPVDISGWTLNGEEGTSGGAANGVFTFPGAPGSLTTVINPGQYIVVGLTAVPNVNFVITGATPGLVLENTDADGVTLRDNTGTVIDAVVWGYKAWTAAVPTWLEGHGLWGQYILFDAAGFLPQGLLTPQRYVDGQDSNVNSADFVMMGWTPGAANGSTQNLPLSFAENCDGAVGTLLPNVSHSFLGAQIFDPAAVTIATGTIRTYPASPQGGNLARIQDPTGGGNVVQPQVVLGDNFLAEVYVYVTGSNPALTVAGQGESWAFGVAGTTNSYATATDVPGTYYAQASLCTGTLNTAPGATGLAWMAYVSQTATNIYLVDLNGGGTTPFTVLAGPITATPGSNDGWQRLRLRVDNGNYVANFGGTYGVDDGQRFTGTCTARSGAVYLQYRECVQTNANLAGMYVDRLEIYGAVASSVLYAGTGSPTSAGTPVINVNGTPTVGNAALTIDGTSMLPFGISLLALDAGTLLPGLPVPGAQPALLLYANPTFLGTVFNGPTGTASYALPLPPTNSLIGTVLSAQYFDFDFSLPFALQLGSSGGAQIAIGNS